MHLVHMGNESGHRGIRNPGSTLNRSLERWNILPPQRTKYIGRQQEAPKYPQAFLAFSPLLIRIQYGGNTEAISSALALLF